MDLNFEIATSCVKQYAYAEKKCFLGHRTKGGLTQKIYARAILSCFFFKCLKVEENCRTKQFCSSILFQLLNLRKIHIKMTI